MHRFDGESHLQALTRRLFERPFTQRQIIIRSGGGVRFIPLSRILQTSLAALCLATAGWVGYTTQTYFNMQIVMSSKDAELARSELAYKDLLEEMATSRQRFVTIARVLEQNHGQLINLVGQNNRLQQDLAHTEERLKLSEAKRDDVVRRGSDLDRQLSALEEQIRSTREKNSTLEQHLESTTDKLSQVLAERTEAEQQRESLKGRVGELQGRLGSLRKSQAQLLARVTEATVKDIVKVEKIIAQIGLNPEDFVSAPASAGKAGKGGKGGPLVTLEEYQSVEGFSRGMKVLNRHIDHWEELQSLLKRLPLTPPLNDYTITSGFGKRQDPLSDTWAMHLGLDFGGAIQSDVMSVAPGRVRYAGWKGGYGRLVEIDHGNGIYTRYAHLRRIKVKRGQTVKVGQAIGQLGNSGRSTGPHLHYEILVNGKQVNPLTFLKAGKNVLKG